MSRGQQGVWVQGMGCSIWDAQWALGVGGTQSPAWCSPHLPQGCPVRGCGAAYGAGFLGSRGRNEAKAPGEGGGGTSSGPASRGWEARWGEEIKRGRLVPGCLGSSPRRRDGAKASAGASRGCLGSGSGRGERASGCDSPACMWFAGLKIPLLCML